MKFNEFGLALCSLSAGFMFGFAAKGCSDGPPKKETPKPPTAIQWIGKLAAGDGNAAVFMCREIEIGLGDKGELLWRRVNAPPPVRNAVVTTNAEAK